jgi:multiple sugar transport system substrate-binding protein
MHRPVALLAPLAAGLALVAAGCGGGGHHAASSSTTPAGTTPKPTAGQTLRIMGFGTNGDDVAMTRFHLARKAIAPAKVSAPNGGFNTQQFLAAVASGNPPDLVYLDRQQVGSLAAKGALQPLTSCIKGQGIAMSQYRAPAVQQVTYGGQVYGIPEFYDNRTVIVNTAFASPSFSTSDWTKLAQTAKRLARTSGSKVTRIGFDPKLPEFFPLWAKANGADLMSSDGKKAQLDSPQAVQALAFAVSLIKEQGGYNAFMAFRNTWDFFGADNQMAKNQLGAFPMEDWYYNVLASTSPHVKIKAVPFTDRNGKPIDWETGSAWAIPAKAKNPALACEWAKTMTETSTWVAAANNRKHIYAKKHQYWTGLFTANQVADQKIDQPTPGEPAEWAQALKTVLNVQKNAFGFPASAASEEFQNAWMNAVTRVLQGQQSPKQALAQAQNEAQTAIDAASHGAPS